MRRDPEFFDDRELVLLYMARRLKDALALEKVLDAAALDYLVEPAPYLGGLLFPFRRVGAFFYVTPEARGQACASMLEHGFEPLEPHVRGSAGT